MKDPKDELIEAQMEYIVFLESCYETASDPEVYVREEKEMGILKSRIRASEKALNERGNPAASVSEGE